MRDRDGKKNAPLGRLEDPQGRQELLWRGLNTEHPSPGRPKHTSGERAQQGNDVGASLLVEGREGLALLLFSGGGSGWQLICDRDMIYGHAPSPFLLCLSPPQQQLGLPLLTFYHTLRLLSFQGY